MAVTQDQMDAMLALPVAERPAGWAWWVTQAQADARDAYDLAEKKRIAAYEAERRARIAAENATEDHGHGHGYCTKCHSYCYGDCEA